MNYLIMALACWRISALFSYECGPWDIFRKFREQIGVLHPNGDCEPTGDDDGFLSKLFGCVWCISVWFAIMIYVCYKLWPGETIIILSPLALSAAVILIEKVIRG